MLLLDSAFLLASSHALFLASGLLLSISSLLESFGPFASIAATDYVRQQLGIASRPAASSWMVILELEASRS